MIIDMSTTVTQAKDQIACSLSEEVAILNLNSALYYSVGDVGGLIWEQLKEEKRVSDICKVVSEGYDVTEAQCESDVIDFLNKLADVGLIEILSPGAET